MSLEFVINGEASVGAWEKPGPLQLGAIAPVPRISTKSGPFSPGEWL